MTRFVNLAPLRKSGDVERARPDGLDIGEDQRMRIKPFAAQMVGGIAQMKAALETGLCARVALASAILNRNQRRYFERHRRPFHALVKSLMDVDAEADLDRPILSYWANVIDVGVWRTVHAAFFPIPKKSLAVTSQAVANVIFRMTSGVGTRPQSQ